MNIIEMNIHDLTPYENNPRVNDNAVEYVANSIKEFGFKVPIIVDKDNIIVAGHTRLKAAEMLGLDTVPVIVADDLNEDQIKAFRLADNKVSEIATWDFDKLNIELETIKLDMMPFSFSPPQNIDWDSGVDDLSEENYDEPEHEMLECPFCHKKDIKIHFKKVE